MNFAQYNNLNLSNDPKWEKDQKNVPHLQYFDCYDEIRDGWMENLWEIGKLVL